MMCIFILLTSCKKVVTEFDCGTVETEITELNQNIDSYTSSNFEQAAIAIYVEGFIITSETETSCQLETKY